MKLTRVKAIRKRCIDCSDGFDDIKNCAYTDCNLYPYRMGKRSKGSVWPAVAIKKHCLWCSNGNFDDLKNCPDKTCPLYPYRGGYVIYTENQSEASNISIGYRVNA